MYPVILPDTKNAIDSLLGSQDGRHQLIIQPGQLSGKQRRRLAIYSTGLRQGSNASRMHDDAHFEASQDLVTFFLEWSCFSHGLIFTPIDARPVTRKFVGSAATDLFILFTWSDLAVWPSRTAIRNREKIQQSDDMEAHWNEHTAVSQHWPGGWRSGIEQSAVPSTATSQQHPLQTHLGSAPASIESGSFNPELPSVVLPRGGGAIRAVGEKFDVNPTTGSGSASIPIETSKGRSGSGPLLNLTYDSGAGNGPFGFGWHLSIGSVTRRTDKGLPRYRDEEDSDIFALSGDDDLVHVLERDATGNWARVKPITRTDNGVAFHVQRFRPRIEGSFSRIERWADLASGICFWRTISRDNLTSTYGRDENSRISDPSASHRIFSWLLCETRDDKGNVVSYEYKPENVDNVDIGRPEEAARMAGSVGSNKIIKRIKYGNVVSSLVSPPSSSSKYLFEVVFDYGEHDAIVPTSAESPLLKWFCRKDPFSTYRPGFELRTYRLCQRILMFHHFPDEPSVGSDCLVQSVDFRYRGDATRGESSASFLESVIPTGYVRNGDGLYTKASMPPLEYSYSQPSISTEVRTLDEESLRNLPAGLFGQAFHWVDLDGEGVSGVLTEVSRAWLYKRNLGNGNFSEVQTLSGLPSLAALESILDRQTLMDLEGNGRLSLAQFGGIYPGFYKRTEDKQWDEFRPFDQIPNLPWFDKNLQFLDVTGDGRTDILLSEADAFYVYASLGDRGFLAGERVQKATDLHRDPTPVFSDVEYTVFTADMSGGGLADLVRIRNSSVLYFPNMGYGRFGPPVAMSNAPRFDASDSFDARRLKLADLDGSGTTDIVYIGPKGISLFLNQAGNSWSNAMELQVPLPLPSNLDDVRVADILGTGTPCLVWSCAIPTSPGRQVCYVELASGGVKPHLLVGMRNNMGVETKIGYAPSTKFYLRDALGGKPWVTRVHFPVHVVEKVETKDLIGRSLFITKYAYHHGYYDGVEREFHGFGMVERWESEKLGVLEANVVAGSSSPSPDDQTWSLDSSTPPVYTKTWTHTGACLQDTQITTEFEREYYREPGLNSDQVRAGSIEGSSLPSEVLLPGGVRATHGLSVDEVREAFRALKGRVLRQETYGLDGTEAAGRPYSVASHSYAVEMLQPQDGGKPHATFLSRMKESSEVLYERKLVASSSGESQLCDARTSHTVVLRVDEWGNTLQSVDIHYGRRDLGAATASQFLTVADVEEQRKARMTYIENQYTNAVDDGALGDYRCPVVYDERQFELVSIPLPSSAPGVTNLLRVAELRNHIDSMADGSHDLPFEDYTAAGAAQEHAYRRPLEHSRILFRKNDFTGPLALGKLESLAIPYESYKMALTSTLVRMMFADGRGLTPGAADGALSRDGGYVHSLGDHNWWMPSGRQFYSLESGDSPAAELEYARKHFFLMLRQRDAFHTDTASTEHTARYDKYDLLLEESVDALGNRVTVGQRHIDPTQPLEKSGHDYRTLQPLLVMDENRNVTMTAFDGLGMAVGSAAMGKPEDQPKRGDTLDGFNAVLGDAETAAYFANPLSNPQSILGGATTRTVYDLSAFYKTRDSPNPKPIVMATLMRETHVSDLGVGGSSMIYHNFSYVDGLGREIQHKERAAPGPVPLRDPATGSILTNGSQPIMGTDTVDPRWVGSGWQIFNAKGGVIRQYESFFSDTHQFDFEPRIGASVVRFYDALQRAVGTLRADHSWSKISMGVWETEKWDLNDTVAIHDPETDPDVGPWFARLSADEYLPTWIGPRGSGDLGSEAKDAALKAAAHANTPGREFLDPMGRVFLSVDHNRLSSPDGAVDTEEFYSMRTQYDIEGNQRVVKNALGAIVAKCDYDMLQTTIHEASMESGERWVLSDVLGKKIYSWNSRGFQMRGAYDVLRRLTGTYLREGQGPEILIESTTYGEEAPDPEARNLRGKVSARADQAGVSVSEEYDFKGNLLRSHRRLAQDYKGTLDHSTSVALEATPYRKTTEYDAASRPTRVTDADSSESRYVFNESGLLRQVEVSVRGVVDATQFVSNIEYDAKRQRTLIQYGNAATTTYQYDPFTFRITQILTRRPATRFPSDCPGAPPSGWPGCQVQSLCYTYDPVGNVTYVRDKAQQTIFFDQQRAEPSSDYTYDSLYRLVRASGREHLGQTGAAILPTASDTLQTRVQDPRNGRAMGRYSEAYKYDAAGNILAVQHGSANRGWTRRYAYEEPSLIEPGKKNNRLSSTTVGNATETYKYGGLPGVHGNITGTAQLPLMEWDYGDRLRVSSRQVVNSGSPEATYYVYGSGGQRIRKVTEWQAPADAAGPPPKKAERIYIGGCEFYRRYDGTGQNVMLERETLHVMDDTHRVAIVETRTQGEGSAPAPAQLTRYQFGNMLDSATLELDDAGQIISYEEYLPFGSTSYQMVRSDVEAPKRYRFTGKERDEESGLHYHGSRYYASWIGRWINCDPAGMVDGLNLYVFVRNGPTTLTDPTGTESKKKHHKAPATKKGSKKPTGGGGPSKSKAKGKKSAPKPKAAPKPPAGPPLHPPPTPPPTPPPPPSPLTDADALNAAVGSETDPGHTPNKSGEKVKDFDITTKVHDQAVLKVINKALDISIARFTKGGTLTGTRREIRKYALDLIIDMRLRSYDNSQNIIFRDADHYFAGSNQEWQTRPEARAILDVVGLAGVYGTSAAKIAAGQPTEDLAKYSGLVSYYYDHLKISGYKEMHAAGKETDADTLSTSSYPTSAPGGREWAAIGREDFREDDFSVVAKPNPVLSSRITWREN